MSKLTLTKGLQMHTNQIILSFLAPGCKTGCKKWDWFDPHWLPSQNWTMSHTHHSKDKPGTKLTLENKAKARKQSQFVVLQGVCTHRNIHPWFCAKLWNIAACSTYTGAANVKAWEHKTSLAAAQLTPASQPDLFEQRISIIFFNHFHSKPIILFNFYIL